MCYRGTAHMRGNVKLRTTRLSIGALNENFAGDMTSDPGSEVPPSAASSSERLSGVGGLVV